MKQTEGSCRKAGAAKAKEAPARVSIRTIYADALREVMSDPRKAVAEHDPWLAALLLPRTPTSTAGS
jgi:hypothetical protein